MHRIVKSHVTSFAQEHGYESDDEAELFEKFSNYCFLQPKVAGKLDLDDVTTGEDDDGIDGIALLVNEELVQTADDAAAVFRKDRRNNEVEISFIQSKRSESFDLGDFLKFKDAVLRFLTEKDYQVDSDLQRDVRGAFDAALDNAPRMRDGKPSISAFFVATGTYSQPKAFEKAKGEFERALESLGYFSRIDVRLLGREELIRAWVGSYSGTEATLLMHSHAGLPQLTGIAESYLAVVKAKDFVEQILTAEDGSIRGSIFEDNVRHFLGPDNVVNKSISETIMDAGACTRFPVLNNGVTLVSPDVVVQTNRLFIKNFQIVNGCQTSHVLFENYSMLKDDMMVTLKIVETDDEDVFGELVRATNSQSAIKESQFLSLSPKARTVEAYFNTFEGQDGRIYFERRDRQYVGRGVPALRVIDLDTAARAVCAMYLRRPDLAYKYPAQMYEEFGSEIFSEENRDIIFYSSSLVLYRIHLLTSSGAISSNARRYKWHVLPIVAAILGGKSMPSLKSKKIDAYAQRIIEIFQSPSDKISELLNAASTKIMELEADSSDSLVDRLKRQGILEELFSKV